MSYSKEFLISELQRFYKENGKSPRRVDMQPKLGYPSYQAYKNHFGSHNNALEIAKLKTNQIKLKLDGTEKCCKCGNYNSKGQNWATKGLPKGKVMCKNCYLNTYTDYMKGNLDKNSNVGFAFISQRVVVKYLGLELKHDCNCSEGFNHPYDLYDKDKHGKVNVKGSHLHDNNVWTFSLHNKYIPDTYILVGFNKIGKHILKGWIINSTNKLVSNKKCLNITNTSRALKKWYKYQLDDKKLDDILYQMSKKRKETKGKECVLSNDDLI